MDDEYEQPHASSSQGIGAAILADAPWNAKSVIAAGIATAGSLAGWIADYSSPVLVGIGASYLAGFFLGWASRRFLRMAALITGGLLASIAVLEETGWIDFDWTTVETQINHAVAAAQQGAQGLKQILSGYLPSTGAAAAGMFFGFRKK
ncbi:MAG TPA: FUN14 domain-containing protein [Nitrospiraceae bacterium]|nr:FUN14 domain-containing protein [Nitrospiraceae bacterium]